MEQQQETLTPGRISDRTHQQLKPWTRPELSRWSPSPAWTWSRTTVLGRSKRQQTTWWTVLLRLRQRSQRCRRHMASGKSSAVTKPHTLTCSARTCSHESSSMSFYWWVVSRRASFRRTNVGLCNMSPQKLKRISTKCQRRLGIKVMVSGHRGTRGQLSSKY